MAEREELMPAMRLRFFDRVVLSIMVIHGPHSLIHVAASRTFRYPDFESCRCAPAEGRAQRRS
jgi:hypothetical protein